MPDCRLEADGDDWVCTVCGYRGRRTGAPGVPRVPCGVASSFPPLKRQAWNLAKSLASFIADGCRTVDAEEYARRLAICDVCDRRKNRRCLDCGCGIDIKARGRAFQCPNGKWAARRTERKEQSV